jgi:hypothetical protein
VVAGWNLTPGIDARLLCLHTSRWSLEIHVTVLSKTQVWSRLFAGVAGSNLARGMDGCSCLLFTYMAVNIDCSDREVDSRSIDVRLMCLHTSRWSIEIHVTVLSKTQVWSRLVAGVAGSNLARGLDVRLLCFYIHRVGLIGHSVRGVESVSGHASHWTM